MNLLRPILAAAATFLAGLSTAVPAATAPPPNLIFILADDLGYGELGCYGQQLIRTPHLDRMAREGMRFTRFYAGAPVCAPSRSVLMTGLHTGHTRVRGNAGKTNRMAQALRREDVTAAEVLHRAGYTTALVGKWGLSEEGMEGVPLKKGFDYFHGYLDQKHAHNPYPEFLVRGETRVPLRNRTAPAALGQGSEDGSGWAVQKRDFAPDLLANDALRWIEENRARPFFLFWSLITPHANNEATRGTGDGQEVPSLGDYARSPWPAPDRGHAAVITRLDADVGRLMALLRRLKLDENTLVIFSSDNGHHREGGNTPELFDANGPLRGLKRDLHDGGIRVPTLARWPGRVPAGVVCETPLWFADLLPTWAELSGAPADATPSKIDGTSFARVLKGEAKSLPARTFYWEFHEGGFSQAVLLDGRWKGIRLKRLDAPIILHDVESDPGENTDLASARPDLVARVREEFARQRTDSTDWPVREAKAPSAR